jgi:hypothetical protein
MNRTNIVGIYDDHDVVLNAIDKIQGNGFKVKDVFSPFPIHDVWEKLDLHTRIPFATFLYGASGTAMTFAFLYWSSVVNYPLKFGGKPLNTLSFIIILFVLTILVGTVLTFITYLWREKMWPGKKVELPDPRTTDDKFAILIEKSADLSDSEIEAINSLLKETGALEVKESNVSYHEK